MNKIYQANLRGIKNIRLDLISSITPLHYQSSIYEGFLIDLFKKDPERQYQVSFTIININGKYDRYYSPTIINKENIGYPKTTTFYKEYEKLVEAWIKYHNN